MRTLCPVLLLCVLVGCSSPQSELFQTTRVGGQDKAVAGLQVAQEPQRRLIKNVALDLRVSNTVAASESLQKLAAELGGHVGSMSATRRNEILIYEMTLRIPEGKLDEAITRIKGLADRIDREMVNQEDVTEKYVDLAARMKTLEMTESELRALLSESRQRQQKAEDIMAIYKELTEIRSSIEQLRGQLNVMDKLTAMATVTLNLYPTESPAVAVSSWKPSATVRRSFQSLVSVLTGLIDFGIMVVIVVIPPILILVAILWLGRKAWRGLRRGSAA